MNKSNLPVPETASQRAIREMQEHERRVRGAIGGLGSNSALEEVMRQIKIAQGAFPDFGSIGAFDEKIKLQNLVNDVAKAGGASSMSAAVAEYIRLHQKLTSDAASYGGDSSVPSRSAPLPPPKPNTITTAADIGALVRKARKDMKMNQSEFALHAGVGRRFLSELENGKTSLEFDKVVACAVAAGIDLIPKVRRGA